MSNKAQESVDRVAIVRTLTIAAIVFSCAFVSQVEPQPLPGFAMGSVIVLRLALGVGVYAVSMFTMSVTISALIDGRLPSHLTVAGTSATIGPEEKREAGAVASETVRRVVDAEEKIAELHVGQSDQLDRLQDLATRVEDLESRWLSNLLASTIAVLYLGVFLRWLAGEMLGFFVDLTEPFRQR